MNNQFETESGLVVNFQDKMLRYGEAISPLIDRLDSERGALYSSNFEFPGRYTTWDIGFVNPPLEIVSKTSTVTVNALNERGNVLMQILTPALLLINDIEVVACEETKLSFKIKKTKRRFIEEERSKQPSVFSVIRAICQFFHTKDDEYLGLYGAFGYDLIFQFEKIAVNKDRDEDKRDMVIYLPDEIFIQDHRKEVAFLRRYEFAFKKHKTDGLTRKGRKLAYKAANTIEKQCDHDSGEYEKTVIKAKQKFACGELFEVVPSQTFFEASEKKPSVIFKQLQETNPAPYGFFINLGDNEFLVGASPEMYVRVQGRKVETCPISGTIKRGKSAIEDAKQVLTLLQSEKECAELTMCTDVDRNDKSRICEPGSVTVIGRRQIEMYSRLIHTVDHVIGTLKEGYDAIDAFLTHMWVVTVTGAPKLWAMRFIEKYESSPRRWYGGAVGWFGFNGHLNTGLTLRTIEIKKGACSVRAGATLLYDSIPKAEEAETRLKAKALLSVLQPKTADVVKDLGVEKLGTNKRILLVDNEDSFVHTLSNYFRQLGANVVTTRDGLDDRLWQQFKPNMLAISPGPGTPKDFPLSEVIDKALANRLPIFGVCLGLQAIVEYYGGHLKQLDYPMHGKASNIKHDGSPWFQGLPKSFVAGRYHSLYADKETLPECLRVRAETEDGLVMAIEHKEKPIYAVQFHPETILSLEDNIGLTLISRVFHLCDEKDFK